MQRLLHEAGTIAEADLGRWLREHGLHSSALDEWRSEIETALKTAQKSGARLRLATDTAGISLRTLERWERNPSDDRGKNNRFAVSNALLPDERRVIRDTVCLPEFTDLNPRQIVSILAEKGLYIGSESTYYRVMRQEGLRVHRGRSRHPSTVDLMSTLPRDRIKCGHGTSAILHPKSAECITICI